MRFKIAHHLMEKEKENEVSVGIDGAGNAVFYINNVEIAFINSDGILRMNYHEDPADALKARVRMIPTKRGNRICIKLSEDE